MRYLLNKVESRYLILLIPAQPHFVVVGGAGDADIKVAHFITIADDIYFVYLVGVYFCFVFCRRRACAMPPA